MLWNLVPGQHHVRVSHGLQGVNTKHHKHRVRSPYHPMRSHSTPFLDHEEISGHPNHASHGFWDRLAAWLPRIQSRGSTPPPVQSNYLTLIPLSDERLKPRHDKALITAAIIFAGLLATAVFVTVPRGVAVGAVKVR